MSSTDIRAPKQARSHASRARLLEATIDCVIERGYGGTTTGEVVKRAGLSQGALYKHFPNKAALMAAAAQRLFARLIDDYRRAFDALAEEDIADVEQRLTAVIELLWTLFHQPPLAAALELYVAARTDRELAIALEPILAEHTGNLRLEAARLFPELISHPDISSVVAGLMSGMQGAALVAPISASTGSNAEERAFIERVVMAEVRRILGERS